MTGSEGRNAESKSLSNDFRDSIEYKLGVAEGQSNTVRWLVAFFLWLAVGYLLYSIALILDKAGGIWSFFATLIQLALGVYIFTLPFWFRPLVDRIAKK